LATKRKIGGRRQLADLTIIAQADTLILWHRELIENSSRNLSSVPFRAAEQTCSDHEIAGLQSLRSTPVSRRSVRCLLRGAVVFARFS
jgi:hypothetical protein